METLQYVSQSNVFMIFLVCQIHGSLNLIFQIKASDCIQCRYREISRFNIFQLFFFSLSNSFLRKSCSSSIILNHSFIVVMQCFYMKTEKNPARLRKNQIFYLESWSLLQIIGLFNQMKLQRKDMLLQLKKLVVILLSFETLIVYKQRRVVWLYFLFLFSILNLT